MWYISYQVFFHKKKWYKFCKYMYLKWVVIFSRMFRLILSCNTPTNTVIKPFPTCRGNLTNLQMTTFEKHFGKGNICQLLRNFFFCQYVFNSVLLLQYYVIRFSTFLPIHFQSRLLQMNSRMWVRIVMFEGLLHSRIPCSPIDPTIP